MYLFKEAKSFTDSGYLAAHIIIEGDTISKKSITDSIPSDCSVIDSHNLYIIPGFVDVHVHLREPGFFYKESIASGTLAAASAGYTAVFSMPNLNPVPDCVQNMQTQLDIISKNAKIKVYPYGAITKGENGSELSDMEALAPYAIAFTDDGRGVQTDVLMKEAMLKAMRLGKKIVAHCEDTSLLKGGYIHDGKYAKVHNHKGICSGSEWKQLERDLKLVEETGCEYHVCHVSSKESVELIRRAKAKGLRVSAETAPHYLVLCDADLQEDGRFKMNPPIRSAEDRDALVEGLRDGTIDMIATDHAPHSDEEKSKGLEGSLMGVIGLETAFAVLYTKLVLNNKIGLHRLIEAMSVAPRKIFGLPEVKIENGGHADLAVLNLDYKWTIKGKECLSKGSSTPFENMEVLGKNMYTILDGEMIWKK